MDVDLNALRKAVQTNCHIADARHAGDYTLCVYLLKMREYYRWERGYGFDVNMPREEVSEWLTEREQLWERLEEQPFAPLPINGDQFDPFDTAAINQALVPHGYVYSGGLGAKAQPHFFLARLEEHHRLQDVSVLVAAQEYARDLNAPPAMSLGRTIFLRRESLRRMLWEKVEEWRWNRLDNPLGRALAHYDFDADVDGALDAMTTRELDTLRHHELGEVQAGERLGEAWHEMLASLPRSKGEIMARAVRDHLADCLATLPALLSAQDSATLHFYAANLTGMRRELFPSLGAAYDAWRVSGDAAALHEMIERGATHWEGVAQAAIGLHREHGAHCLSHVEALIDDHRL